MLSEKFMSDLNFALSHGEPSFYGGKWCIVPSDDGPNTYDIYPDYAVDSAHKPLPNMGYSRIAAGISGSNISLIAAAPELFHALVSMTDATLYYQEEHRWRIEQALLALGGVMLVYPD